MKLSVFSKKKEPEGVLTGKILKAAAAVSAKEMKFAEVQKVLKDPKHRTKTIVKKLPFLLRLTRSTVKKVYRHRKGINKALLSIANVVEYKLMKF